MTYICERCIHKYPNGGCIVPCTIGYTGKCYYFYEKPKHTPEQTNEEWFCSLSTEEKAKWLENKMTWAAQEQGTFTAKGWSKWLKQPHKEIGK